MNMTKFCECDLIYDNNEHYPVIVTENYSSNSSNIEINITNSRQLSTVYFFGMISLRLTRERIENRLYIKFYLTPPKKLDLTHKTRRIKEGDV